MENRCREKCVSNLRGHVDVYPTNWHDDKSQTLIQPIRTKKYKANICFFHERYFLALHKQPMKVIGFIFSLQNEVKHSTFTSPSSQTPMSKAFLSNWSKLEDSKTPFYLPWLLSQLALHSTQNTAQLKNTERLEAAQEFSSFFVAKATSLWILPNQDRRKRAKGSHCCHHLLLGLRSLGRFCKRIWAPSRRVTGRMWC